MITVTDEQVNKLIRDTLSGLREMLVEDARRDRTTGYQVWLFPDGDVVGWHESDRLAFRRDRNGSLPLCLHWDRHPITALTPEDESRMYFPLSETVLSDSDEEMIDWSIRDWVEAGNYSPDA